MQSLRYSLFLPREFGKSLRPSTASKLAAQGLRRDCRVGRNNRVASAFTLLELIACISIIAVIAGAIAMPALVDMFTKSRQISDQRTLLTLNDAINRFKCEGGGTAGLTAGAPVSHVLAAMQGDINWNGFHHNVMQAGQTFHGKSIDALGVGSQYHFTRFGTYTAEAGGTSPSDLGASGGSLVGWWKFDETSGTTVADSSGNGNTGTFLGENAPPSWTTGKIGNSLNFNNLESRVIIPSNASLKYTGGNMTISLWEYETENDTGNVVSKPWNAAGDHNYQLFSIGGAFYFYMKGATPWQTSSISVSKNSWHFIVITADSMKNVSLFVDGAPSYSGTHTISSWTPPGGDSNKELVIGSLYPYSLGTWSAGNATKTFGGMIDDVRIYNRALTAAEVAQLYNSP